MVDGVHTEVANLSVEGVELVQEAIFQLGQRVDVGRSKLSEVFVHPGEPFVHPGEPVNVALFSRFHRRSKLSEAFVHSGEPGIHLCQQGDHRVPFLIRRVQFLILSTKDMSDLWGGSNHGLVQSVVGIGSLVV
jgi:hypothetical protein